MTRTALSATLQRNMPGRNLVVVGASAGGVEALTALVGSIPADLSAAVLVTLHLPPQGSSVLARILSRAGPLAALPAVSGEAIEEGRIYVARSDRHLLVEDGRIKLGAGPKENGARPAIDPLFRSAAHSYGAATVGVILSGTRDDGVAGLAAIKRHGGVTIAQDPHDALFAEMPEIAISTVGVDHVLPAGDMGKALKELVGKGGALRVAESSDERTRQSDPIDEQAPASERNLPGDPSPFACPDCGGVMWDVKEDGVPRYRCRTGHAYSPDGLLAKQEEALEDLLWSAVRALEESADLADRPARRSRRGNREATAIRFERRATEARNSAGALQELLVAELGSSAREDEAHA